MHPTTFTIESVHGVKQTFVLGLTTKTGDREAAKKPSASNADNNNSDDQGSWRSPR